MYRYFKDKNYLWEKSSWGHPRPLRSKPIIRLQDDSHVEPFREDGSSSAYLPNDSYTEPSISVVKAEICQDEEARKFLVNLNFPELNPVVVVIERILPKYDNDSVVTIEKHRLDINAIENAYRTASEEEKNRLCDRLRKTPFILAESQGLEEPMYRRPSELYFASEKLRLYFSGNSEIEFINNTEYTAESIDKILKNLGVADFVRVSPERECNEEGHIVLKEVRYHGHERGRHGFDPDTEVEGLQFALDSLTQEKSEFIWNFVAYRYISRIRGVVESCKRQDYTGSTYKEKKTSEFGRLLIERAWLPSPDGGWKKPGELAIDDLPESFKKHEELAQKLGMKRDVVANLAEEVGLTAEAIEILRNKKLVEEFMQWKGNNKESATKETSEFPEKASWNLERRQEKFTEELRNSPTKKYEQRGRSVRISKGKIDPRPWLRNQYTNRAGQVVCQICKEKMPFKKRNGEYYFEDIEALGEDYFPKEHEAQYLALCPTCAAMYKEFVKREPKAMSRLVHEIRSKDEREIPLDLGERKNMSIEFTEIHFQDIKTVLEEQERD